MYDIIENSIRGLDHSDVIKTYGGYQVEITATPEQVDLAHTRLYKHLENIRYITLSDKYYDPDLTMMKETMKGAHFRITKMVQEFTGTEINVVSRVGGSTYHLLQIDKGEKEMAAWIERSN